MLIMSGGRNQHTEHGGLRLTVGNKVRPGHLPGSDKCLPVNPCTFCGVLHRGHAPPAACKDHGMLRETLGQFSRLDEGVERCRAVGIPLVKALHQRLHAFRIANERETLLPGCGGQKFLHGRLPCGQGGQVGVHAGDRRCGPGRHLLLTWGPENQTVRILGELQILSADDRRLIPLFTSGIRRREVVEELLPHGLLSSGLPHVRHDEHQNDRKNDARTDQQGSAGFPHLRILPHAFKSVSQQRLGIMRRFHASDSRRHWLLSLTLIRSGVPLPHQQRTPLRLGALFRHLQHHDLTALRAGAGSSDG